MPPFVGRPAKLVGEATGGSLSADTYKSLGTVFLPTMVSTDYLVVHYRAHK